MRIVKFMHFLNIINLAKLIVFFHTLIFTFSMPAQAIYIDSDVTDLSTNKKFHSKSFFNNTKNMNMYNFNMYRIDYPGKKEKSFNIKNGEVIYTPLKKILLPGEREYFKILYRGEDDNQERYYRMVITETSLGAFEDKKQNKSFYFTPTISLDTYFVVRPKDVNFNYKFNLEKGLIENIGNTYFRVIIHNSCTDKDPDVFYLLPSQKYEDVTMKKKGNKLIVFMDKFILLDSPCKE
ncbi:fimbrial protein [Moellerella wisconsensis]|uniref:fimbrial protein n=2 Tax=Moellerella wisconsensis TaxID=158849 RepID=UPI003075F11C